MAIAYRATSGQTDTGGTSWVINKPATGGTVVSGDVMLAFLTIDGTSGPVTGGTPPSGWAAVDLAIETTWPTSSVLYWKVAGGSEPSSYTWTLTGARDGLCFILAYSGADGTNPIEQGESLLAPADAGGPFEYVTDSVTAAGADRMLVAFFSIQLNTTATGFTASGMNSRANHWRGAISLLAAGFDEAVGAGSYTRTGTMDNDGLGRGVPTYLVALKEYAPAVSQRFMWMP